MLDVVECDMADEQQEAVDWVAAFPPEPTNLESLSFECYEPPVAFAALEALVARSPRLSRLGVNLHVSLGQQKIQCPTASSGMDDFSVYDGVGARSGAGAPDPGSTSVGIPVKGRIDGIS